jgi:hypothetical protein
MVIDMKDIDWLSHVYGPLVCLAEQYRSYPSKMSALGWQQLATMESCLEELPFRNKLPEYWTYLIEKAKQAYGWPLYQSDFLESRTKASQERVERSQNPLDDWITEFDRELHTCRFNRANEFQALKDKFDQELEQTLQHEMDTKLVGYSDGLDDNSINDRWKLLDRVVSLKLGIKSFVFDKMTAERGSRVYTKPLDNEWKLAIWLDDDSFTRIFNGTSRNASCGFWFGVVPNNLKINRWLMHERFKRISFIHAFPLVHSYLFCAYENFGNLRELELNLLANMDLFLLIVDDVTAMLRTQLSSFPNP